MPRRAPACEHWLVAHPFGSQKSSGACGCCLVIGQKDERTHAPERIVSGRARSGRRASLRSGRALSNLESPVHS
jgi:hypothetical protein